MTKQKSASAGWLVGKRVRREKSPELGTIVETDVKIKVKWEGGRTSYFKRDEQSNVKLEPDL